MIEFPEFATRDRFERRLSELPPSPRPDAESFYSGLLALHEDIRRKGYPKPIKLLADGAGVPEGTIKTRLAVAKRRAAAGVAGGADRNSPPTPA